MKKQLIFFSFVFIFVVSSFVIAVEPFFQKTGGVISSEENGVVTFLFNQTGQDEMMTLNKKDRFANIEQGSFIKTDSNGTIKEVNLTATNSTSWTFGNQTVKVNAGMRVVYKDGVLKIFGNENQTCELKNKNSGSTNSISLANNSELSVIGGLFTGKNFNVDGIGVKEGGLLVSDGGYILRKNSIADWNGLTLGSGKELFLASSQEAYDSRSTNALFANGLKLQGKGEDFTVKFNEGNAFAHVDARDNFEIKAGKGFEFSLENRNPDIKQEGKIPLMNIKGEFMINQDSKTIYTDSRGEILITKQKDGVLFNKETTNKGSSTSPIELQVDGKNSKYIVSNFNGVATVPKDVNEGQTDERYANSIYWKKASVENRYNYPNEDNLLENSKIKIVWGKGFNIDDSTKTHILRELADYGATLPEQYEKFDPIIINLIKGDAAKLNYNPITNSIDLPLTEEELAGLEDVGAIGGMRHEVGHLYHDFLYGESFLKLKLKDETIQQYRDKLLNTPFAQEWLNINDISSMPDLNRNFKILLNEGDALKKRTWKKSINCNSDLGPCYGYVKPYGVTFSEDMTTFIEKIVGDPAFFRRNSLLGENADPRYVQKLNLLKNYGFITPQEYDAVLHPEKYFSQEELAMLLQKN